MVRYIYDCWGNHAVVDADGADVTDGVGILNPYRYRGYYYDTETGLYYLQTRYYDPKLGRFISQDSIDYADPKTINGLNLYAYCSNNPVMYVDPNGTAKWWHWLAGALAIIGAILVVAAITVLTAGVGTTILAGTMIGAVIHGAAVGALIGAGVGITAGAIIGGAVSGWTAEGILTGMGIGFGAGAIIGAVIGGVAGYGSYSPSKISGFTEHGLNQVIQRNGHGVSNRALLDTIKTPNNIIKQGGFFKPTYKFVSSKAVVVLNKVGKVVTAWAKKSLWWRF